MYLVIGLGDSGVGNKEKEGEELGEKALPQ